MVFCFDLLSYSPRRRESDVIVEIITNVIDSLFVKADARSVSGMTERIRNDEAKEQQRVIPATCPALTEGGIC